MVNKPIVGPFLPQQSIELFFQKVKCLRLAGGEFQYLGHSEGSRA